MSAAVVPIRPIRQAPTNGHGAKHKPTKRELRLKRKVDEEAMERLRGAVNLLLFRDGLEYRDAVVLFQCAYMDAALKAADGKRGKAGKFLGLSREHVTKYYKRGAKLVE